MSDCHCALSGPGAANTVNTAEYGRIRACPLALVRRRGYALPLLDGGALRPAGEGVLEPVGVVEDVDASAHRAPCGDAG